MVRCQSRMANGEPVWRAVYVRQVWRGNESGPSRRPHVCAVKLLRYPRDCDTVSRIADLVIATRRLSVKFDLANWPWAPTILAAIFLAIPVTLYVVQPFLF